MLSDPDAQHIPADWYLIASGGDLVLRLVQDLQIGEDGTGGIVLSPAREKALLRVSTRGGELTLQALALHWTFCQNGGSTRQHLTFPAGTCVRLNFPTCSLVITPEFHAGERTRPDCVVDLRPTTPPALALSRLSEPVTLVDQPVVSWQNLPPIGVATTEEIAALLEATSEDDSERLLEGDHDVPDEAPVEIPVLKDRVAEESPIRAPAPQSPDTVRPTSRESGARAVITPSSGTASAARRAGARRVRTRHRALAAAVAALALLAPMALLLDEPEALGIHFLRSSYLPPGQAPDPVWPEDPVPALAVDLIPALPPPSPSVDDPAIPAGSEGGTTPAPEDAQTFAEPLPLADEQPLADAPSPETAPSDGAAGPRPLTDRDTARVAVLIAEAQDLLDTGNVVTPVHDNAVERLVEALTLDPTNETGLRLMYDSAVRLVEEAEAAHAAGDDYLARNLLEDVLGFHPEFEMARRLQRDWNAEGNG